MFMSMWSVSQYLARAEDPPRNKECGAQRHETSTIPTEGSQPLLRSAILNSPTSVPNTIFAVATRPIQIFRTQTSARLLGAALPQHLLSSCSSQIIPSSFFCLKPSRARVSYRPKGPPIPLPPNAKINRHVSLCSAIS